MMETHKVKALIEGALPDATVEVVGDGQHFQALIVSSAFEGKTRLARERLVNSHLKPYFDSGELHALAMRTLTPEQWASEKG